MHSTIVSIKHKNFLVLTSPFCNFSREINQATHIRTQVRPSVGMRNGGVSGMFNDSNLTPRAHQARRIRLVDRSAPLTTVPDDSPPDYFSVVQSPPSFDDIFGSREKKQPIDQHS